ncbi:MAG TPA: DsbA family protein, partial [Myxococcota bacterium]|nr:DsbA family protein [Myxococcota bacterium]
EARRLGATGVPLFVFDRRSAIPGAASVHTLRAAIEQALDAA